LQAQEREEIAYEFLYPLIKNLYLIISRPSRLLECLVGNAFVLVCGMMKYLCFQCECLQKVIVKCHKSNKYVCAYRESVALVVVGFFENAEVSLVNVESCSCFWHRKIFNFLFQCQPFDVK
jgi:hypothetical protein